MRELKEYWHHMNDEVTCTAILFAARCADVAIC
jgi:hypothetical protein